MKKLILSLLLSCFATAGMSQDSLTYAIIKQALLEDSLAREEMRFNRDGIFMPLRGIIQTFTHRSFNRLPGPFVNKEKHPEDWGLALSPLAATWVMKAFGVKSRSTTRRMLTANGLALGLTVGLSQTLRWSVTEERPDHSDSHGLPSMHASLAFMGATVLSREYGHISHWITIGGYAAATGTQMLRIGHNRHWMNDIFLGAGIGVVSTNLAYYLTDKILGKKRDYEIRAVAGNMDWSDKLEDELCFSVGRHVIYLAHGHRFGVHGGTYRLTERARQMGADIAVYGHTHAPDYGTENDVLVINPGSIAKPRQDGWQKTYAVMTIDKSGKVDVEFKHLPGRRFF